MIDAICRTYCNPALSLGQPTFQVKGKTLAVLEGYKGELSICLKVGKNMPGVFVADPRYYRTPYSGKHDWISLKAYPAPLDWNEIDEQPMGSHGLAWSSSVSHA